MSRLLQIFVEIAVWRKGPQDLPASTSLLALAGGCYAVLGFVQIRLIGYSLLDTMLLVIIDVSALSLWLLGVLSLFGFRSRLTQTLTAMFGVGVLLTLVDMTIRGAAFVLGAPAIVTAFAFPQLIMILLVLGRILMLALERGLLTGMALSLAMVWSSIALGNLFVTPIVSAQ